MTEHRIEKVTRVGMASRSGYVCATCGRVAVQVWRGAQSYWRHDTKAAEQR